jgi:hypothetical protein
MEAGHNLEVSVDLEKMNKKTNKTYWRSKCEEIVKGVCALLNTYGGKLCIKIENENVPDVENVLDNFLRATEQRLKQFMSLWYLNQLVKMPNIQEKKFVYEIRHSENKVFTIKYHLYLPTLKQVEEIPPSEAHERIKEMSDPTTAVQSYSSKMNEFIFGKSVLLTESDSVQFKHLSNEKSTKITIAGRIINESNKLNKTISAFANQSGGQVLYGISNDGIVHGQKLEEKDKSEIEAKVTKEINKMIWLQEPIEKGKHWNIEFEAVKDEENNEIAFLFVIRISIQPLPGGVFVQQPESYQIGRDERVQLMSFEDWRSRIFYGVTPVPPRVGRINWSSTASHRKYFKAIFPLNELHCQAKYKAFNDEARSIKEKHVGTATELFVMLIESVVAYKRGMMKTANEIIKRVEESLQSSQNIDDRNILQFRLLYAKSAIARAAGDTELCYKYAQEGQQVADLIQPGVFTAWFFNHVAIVEKFLSEEQQKQEDQAKMETSALNHFIRALQHAKASYIEQEFIGMIADLEQRIHIFRAITILGNFKEGANLKDVKPSKIKAAKNDLQQYDNLVYDGFLPSNYRRAYSLFAQCDLRFAQWGHHQKQQKQLPEQKVYNTPELLKDAYDKAFEGRELSKQCNFEELVMYGNCRLGRISTVMVKLNFATSFSKRRRDSCK